MDKLEAYTNRNWIFNNCLNNSMRIIYVYNTYVHAYISYLSFELRAEIDFPDL